MIKLKDILFELEFSSPEELAKYKKKHKISKNTQVKVDGKFEKDFEKGKYGKGTKDDPISKNKPKSDKKADKKKGKKSDKKKDGKGKKEKKVYNFKSASGGASDMLKQTKKKKDDGDDNNVDDMYSDDPSLTSIMNNLKKSFSDKKGRK